MIVALTGQKGGVGKSTLSVCLASEALSRGMSVMVVDADPQGTARTWGDVARERERPTPTIVAMGAGMHRPDQLPRIAATFDLVLIDCPPRADEVQRSALMVADLALLPCGPASFDGWALASSFQVIAEARTFRPMLDAAVVVNRKRTGTVLGQTAREALGAGELPVLRSELGDRVAYQEATSAGMAVSAYAPRSEAATEIMALLDEVLARGGKQAPGTPATATNVATTDVTPPAPSATRRKPTGKAPGKPVKKAGRARAGKPARKAR